MFSDKLFIKFGQNDNYLPHKKQFLSTVYFTLFAYSNKQVESNLWKKILSRRQIFEKSKETRNKLRRALHLSFQ